MTQDEFYSKLMQDVEYIFKTGFKLSPEMFMQTMSYASEQYELLSKRIEELEASTKDMSHLYNELNTIKWWSAEKGDAWDCCVDAICDLIKKEYLPKDSK
jgi:hypothetical protein